MSEQTQAVTPQWFKTTCYVILASFLCGIAGIVLALFWRFIKWIFG